MTVLVTGATGNVGSAAVRELAARGVPVRALVRDPGVAVERLGDEVELAVGDLSDPGSIRAALAGVGRVLVSTGDGPEKVRHEAALVDAAAAAGVELVVKASTLGAEVGSPLKPFDWHGRSEEHLRRSGVPAVILRSCWYMTNLLAGAEQVRAGGALLAPAGEGRVAMIDPRDVGAVAASVLAGAGHAGRTYRLTGPEAITYARVAEELSRAAGTEIEYVDAPPQAARWGFEAAGMPGWLVDHLDGAFALLRASRFEETTDTARVLAGRDPRTVADFARDHAAAFAPVPQNA